jgi:hypothetical protein
MTWIIYSDTKVIRKAETDEFSASVAATVDGYQYTADTFPDYTVDDLEVVNGVVQVKATWEADRAAVLLQDQKDFLRSERNELLKLSDWTQVPDSPLTDAKKTEWATYRQALRDLPYTTTDFANPVWPSQPS